jgi:2,3-bisphosphoglycerate-dependent phosphoglycerate mutase
VSVILIRHAEATGQEPDAPLTPQGLAHAQALAAALHDRAITRFISSPFRRARETADVLADGAGVLIDERLAEWQLPWIQQTEWPHALRSILAGSTALPGDVEPLITARARGLAAVREALALPGDVIALVTHGKLLALVLAELEGADPYEVFRTLRNAQAFEVRAVGTEVHVRSLWHPSV